MASFSSCAVFIHYFEHDELTDKSHHAFLENSHKKVLSIINELSMPIFLYHKKGLKISPENSKEFLEAKDLFLNISNSTQEYENILFFHSNMPLLDKALSEKILAHHHRYLSDYSFYEYYPWGLAPFAVNKATFKKISLFSQELEHQDYHPWYIDQFVKKDLNQYDTEILVAPHDFRFLKEDFIITDTRNSLILEQLSANFQKAENLLEFLTNHAQDLRSSPTFIEISLTNTRNQEAVFQYFDKNSLKEPSFFSLEVLESLIKQISSQNKTATIQFSCVEGEPLLYPYWDKLFNLIQQYPHLSFILETNGLALKESFIQNLLETKNLKIILFLSAVSAEGYSKIHQTQDFELIESMSSTLLHKNFENTYLQFVRMNDNEKELPLFLERWSSFQSHLLISQYNDISGYLEDKKVIDLTPLKRFPCFKLQRELFINSKEEVRLCIQDQVDSVFKEKVSLSTDLPTVYKKLDSFYKQHWEDKKDLPSLCQKCDIWYHFNF